MALISTEEHLLDLSWTIYIRGIRVERRMSIFAEFRQTQYSWLSEVKRLIAAPDAVQVHRSDLAEYEMLKASSMGRWEDCQAETPGRCLDFEDLVIAKQNRTSFQWAGPFMFVPDRCATCGRREHEHAEQFCLFHPGGCFDRIPHVFKRDL